MESPITVQLQALQAAWLPQLHSQLQSLTLTTSAEWLPQSTTCSAAETNVLYSDLPIWPLSWAIPPAVRGGPLYCYLTDMKLGDKMTCVTGIKLTFELLITFSIFLLEMQTPYLLSLHASSMHMLVQLAHHSLPAVDNSLKNGRKIMHKRTFKIGYSKLFQQLQAELGSWLDLLKIYLTTCEIMSWSAIKWIKSSQKFSPGPGPGW